MNADHVAVGSSDGSVTLLRLTRDVTPHYKESSGWTLNKVAHWKNIHGTRYSDLLNTSPVFEWSKHARLVNCPVFKWDLNTRLVLNALPSQVTNSHLKYNLKAGVQMFSIQMVTVHTPNHLNRMLCWQNKDKAKRFCWVIHNTMNIWVPNIWLPETSKFRTLWSLVFKWHI
jgi:hypothetical protein